jgi:hypothetical protein
LAKRRAKIMPGNWASSPHHSHISSTLEEITLTFSSGTYLLTFVPQVLSTHRSLL